MCVVHLRPHFQLDELVASVKLVTETGPATG
jgi:predicted component of type VI protein secretion system